jgi:outer membrane immunogenic protein
VLVCALGLVSHPSLAQSDHPWAGPYIGLNAGAAHSSTCVTSSLQGVSVIAASDAGFGNRYCPSGDFVGGLQIGENFQIDRFVWGIGADLDYWSAKNVEQTSKYAGSAAPAGAYSFSGKLNPGDFFFVGPRVGYAGDLFLPYLRVGGVVTSGSHSGSLSYASTVAAKPSASFSTGENFSSTGWGAGGGVEIGLNGAWSVTLDYLHINLGQSSRSSAVCDGSPADCSVFAGTSLDSTHGAFSANVFRIGINYWFRYWEP